MPCTTKKLNEPDARGSTHLLSRHRDLVGLLFGLLLYELDHLVYLTLNLQGIPSQAVETCMDLHQQGARTWKYRSFNIDM